MDADTYFWKVSRDAEHILRPRNLGHWSYRAVMAWADDSFVEEGWQSRVCSAETEKGNHVVGGVERIDLNLFSIMCVGVHFWLDNSDLHREACDNYWSTNIQLQNSSKKLLIS